MDQPCLGRWPSSTHRRQAARRGHWVQSFTSLQKAARSRAPFLTSSQVAGCRVPLCRRCPAERAAQRNGAGAAKGAGGSLRSPSACCGSRESGLPSQVLLTELAAIRSQEATLLEEMEALRQAAASPGPEPIVATQKPARAVATRLQQNRRRPAAVEPRVAAARPQPGSYSGSMRSCAEPANKKRLHAAGEGRQGEKPWPQVSCRSNPRQPEGKLTVRKVADGRIR